MSKFLKSNIFFFLLLAVTVFTLYGKSITFGFTYGDDNTLILEKAEFLSDIKNLPKIFTTSVYYSKDFPYYRPLLNLSFMAQTVLFGVNTKVYHLTNIILFILSLYLMYLFLIKLFRKCTMYNKRKDTEVRHLNTVSGSYATILKFLFLLAAVHPVFTSTAVWIPASNDSLLALFLYSSFIFFIRYLEDKKTKNLLLYFLFFAAALFTKESAILAVFLYVFFVWCFGYKPAKKEILKNILIFIPVIAFYLYFRHLAVSGGNILVYFKDFFQYLQNLFEGSVVYLYQFVIPDIHVMLYNVRFTPAHWAVSGLITFFIIFGLYKNFIDKKIFLWCVFVFLLFIFPTCFLDDYIILNHRLFVTVPAVIIILTFFIDGILNGTRNISLKNIPLPNAALTKISETNISTTVPANCGQEQKSLKFINKKFFLLLFFILFFVYSSVSFAFQNNYREKNIYWIKSYMDAPDCHATCYQISRIYFEQGNFEKAKEFLDKANKLKLIYLSDLALIYYFEKDFDKAEELYNRSVQTGVNKAQCFRNLSVIYLQRDNDIDKAILYAQAAVKEEPYEYSYRKYLETLLNEKNKF